MDLPHNDELDSTPDIDWKSSLPNEPLMTFDDENEIPIRISTNPNPHPITPPPPATTAQIRETHNPVLDSIGEKTKTELKKGQHQAEDIITKSKRILKQHCKFHERQFFLDDLDLDYLKTRSSSSL